MTHHLWFIVAAIIGQPDSPLPVALVQGGYSSWQACMYGAHLRTSGIRSAGIHGRYICMYHGEPDRALARTPVGAF